MISYGEVEENFIRKLFEENIKRRDNFRDVTGNGKIILCGSGQGQ